MADYQFIVNKIRRPLRWQAARWAVFANWFGRSYGETRNTVKALAVARKSWRTRLMGLRDAGWAPLQDNQVFFFRNCPPFGVTTGRQSVPCHKPVICPFCHGRRVADVFMAFERLVWGNLTAKAHPAAPAKLVLLRRSFRKKLLPAHAAKKRQAHRLVLACRWLRNTLEYGDRRRDLKVVRGYQGGFVFHRLAVVRNRLVLQRNGLFVVPAGWDVAKAVADTLPGLVWEEEAAITRANLARFLAKACRYNDRLWGIDARTLRVILDEFKGADFSSRLGRLRARSPSE